ncbi:hypothetical protein H704_00721 [Bartonella bacilliformis Peru38]|uniref:ABC transporter substrate-binding protein n=1 Tax=Bartonella bacilliformis TaxID=774 RepID=UPI000325EB47|nr:ABC transporter substrate-binding protein [Bartonella bacilliformis]EYS89908.1 hypothetical protein X472_00353 [Bartonella bacilliformis San Pedro600-02]EYS95250.1 hypothetical protein X470_00772 [Bartonella bacilliformis Peru-18]KEG17319.1 hypothetical protein H709_00664 [Bartonella bacilliformis CUSCO5]KEG20478.1 hypothetical protein H704_00721 [Bartonella bacilliformis Peru38]KEG22860.1 hypothetical protein H703_00707 [Bartonella bacilliformis Ver075]
MNIYGLQPFSKKVEHNEECTEITLFLNPKARFSDGEPIKIEDVLFTIELLKEKGRPPFNRYMKNIESIEIICDHGIKMRFHTQKIVNFRFFWLVLCQFCQNILLINVDDFEKNSRCYNARKRTLYYSSH